ncbi:hypothetical protein TheetDRAFT_2180 [Thermoanaerobacter ethanolicus JW 200]|uniref:hypothetical protein n=1 Tax=Thermoanaerobacter ethanolicus TaxID=1757 RepID=UPI000202B54A|nr:hypothetical protein TheetDRAFT_2180 [Thermoanaerobacter ethanolicus JW 200]
MEYSPYNLMNFESEFALLPHLIHSKKTIEHIKKLFLEKNSVIADGYGHKVYRCPKCDEFYGRFFIHLDYDGDCFEVKYRCPKCKVVLHPIDCDVVGEQKAINLENYPCPKCGKYSRKRSF